MALYQFLCGVVVVIVLSANGSSSSGECGKMTRRGEAGSAPWKAVIKREDRPCTGALISEQWVLTVPKCCSGAKNGTTVILGQPQDIQLNDAPRCSNGTSVCSTPSPNQPHTVEEVIYKNITSDGQGKMSVMCLLKLNKPVSFTDSVRPIRLASDQSTRHSKPETYVLADEPNPVLENATLVEESRCAKYYPRMKGMICARRKTRLGRYNLNCQPGKGAMMVGDQGGAWTLLGVSNGDQTCDGSEELLSFYPVLVAREWIMDVTGMSRESLDTLTFHELDRDDEFDCQRCPHQSPFHCRDVGAFTGGANMIPASPFVLLFVLALSLSFTKW